MNDLLEFSQASVLIGAGATLVMDLWGVFQKRVLGWIPLDYRLLGRWIGHLFLGKFVHVAIAAARPISGEKSIGWLAHYAIGITFAGLLLAWRGLAWAQHPTPMPALLVGLVTVVAPFFLMQPCMGAGIAASKTPRPNVARIKSLLTHTVYGLGLYLAGLAYALMLRGSVE